MPKRHPHQGFSLIEMAVVLFIVVLLLGSLLVPFATQVEQRRIAETQHTLEEAREALIGFAIANNRLPCPDTNNDGLEDLGTPCNASEGNLPWTTLGIAKEDAWGDHFFYRVKGTFAITGGITLTPPASGLNVCTSVGCPSPPGINIAKNVPAVILSYGKNGFGSIKANRAVGDMTKTPCPVPACSKDEQENMNGDDNFVSRAPTPANTPNGEFDDIVAWVPLNILLNRMVAAQKLP